MEKPSRVAVAMSGGVDSSVAAALLVQQGYDVVGMMMRLWSEPGAESQNRCCTPDAMAMARRVAARLGIPFYAIDAQQTFRDLVVESFLQGYASGGTPNPCLVCNRHIRWEFLLKHALALGATHMATGHYARLRTAQGGNIQLLKAADKDKDQSYVLHVLGQEQLEHALFPLGEYTKSQVRQMAREFNLPVAERSESQDLCFLAGRDYRDFLARHLPGIQEGGPILSRDGDLLGTHQGLAFYTIGQRKGLGIAAASPLYVLEKDLTHNALIVGEKEDLGKQELIAAKVNWVSQPVERPPVDPFQAEVKIRYRAKEARGVVTPIGEQRFHVRFDQPQRDITPGQAAVLYQEEVCLGGGIIETGEDLLITD